MTWESIANCIFSKFMGKGKIVAHSLNELKAIIKLYPFLQTLENICFLFELELTSISWVLKKRKIKKKITMAKWRALIAGNRRSSKMSWSFCIFNSRSLIRVMAIPLFSALCLLRLGHYMSCSITEQNTAVLWVTWYGIPTVK